MSYDVALEKAWEELAPLKAPETGEVRFFTDTYVIDSAARTVTSRSCNVPAKEYISILVLHYYIQKLKKLPDLTGEWISFKELEAGESYYPAFRKRAIEPVIRKYGSNPSGLWSCVDKGIARKISQADAAVAIDAFEGVPVAVELWKADDEFGAEANMLFDRSIAMIFCTEDVAVLGQFVAKHV